MNFKTILLLTATMVLPTTSYALSEGHSFIKEVKLEWQADAKLYQGKVSGKCYYLQRNGNQAILSEVDCRDFGVDVSKNNPEKGVDTNNSFDTIRKFLAENCSRQVGTQKYTCVLPREYLEKQEYLRLKKKFEEK